MSEFASDERNYLHDLAKRLSMCTTVAERLTAIFENYKTGDKSFTRKYFAQENNVSYQTFCKYLDGTIEVPLRVVKMISEKTGISCDLIINGVDTQNIRGYKLYGLTDNALTWLIQHKGTAAHEMLNLILSDEKVANSLFSALALYAQKPKVQVSVGGTDISDKLPDKQDAFRYFIADTLCHAVEIISTEWREEASAEKVRELMEHYL